MAIASISDLVQALGQLPLLQPVQRLELDRRQKRLSDPKALVQNLVQRGWLTAYQGKRLLQGQAADLLLGPYVILDSLGEGGMGQIFKARHSGLDRLAAVKVLRQELVTDGEMLQRFLREIKLASQLAKHPHLVHAFDAGPVGGTYFLAMEFIEGIDLDQLVRESGPLPVQQACDYIRQAALGLQHAHEHGLVHRDIKPANLLVTPRPGKKSAERGTVRVLDLGLARLQGKGTGPGQTILTLTSDGTMTMGTVDYMAPEQALDLHRADIRADVYSLGCTFYYLLTGKPPFGGGPLAVKLMRHQQAEPPDLKERRPDVPAGLIPIVRRMLAKNPADRYQTPGDVAAALDQLARTKSTSAGFFSAVYGTSRFTLKAVALLLRGLGQAARKRPRLLFGGAGGLLLLGLLLWLGPVGFNRDGAGWSDHKTPPSTRPELLMERPSPLDQLDPAKVKGRQPEWPNEVVGVMNGHRLAESYVKFSPDGRLLAVCGDNTSPFPVLWNLAGAEPKIWATCEGRNEPVSAVAFSADGKLLAAGEARTVRVWDLTGLQPKERNMLGDRSSPLAFAPDGYRLACSVLNRGSVRLVDLVGPSAVPRSRLSSMWAAGLLRWRLHGTARRWPQATAPRPSSCGT